MPIINCRTNEINWGNSHQAILYNDENECKIWMVHTYNVEKKSQIFKKNIHDFIYINFKHR